MAPPAEPRAGQLRAAIWDDLQLNGMIGNGNEVASLWMNFWGYADDPPLLHILDLACRGSEMVQRCRFDLLREGGAIVVDGRTVPDRIRCRAMIRRTRDGEGEWAIPHLPPNPGGGHSRTTLRCEWVMSR